MLMPGRLRGAIERGEVTLTFRRWKRCQVVAGHEYRTAAGRLHVEEVVEIAPARISEAEARAAGFSSAAEVVGALRGSDDLPTYRIRFRAAGGADPRDELAAVAALTRAEFDDLARRLDRLDRAGAHGPWTAAVLHAIQKRPGVRAGDLAASFGREKEPFKIDVRKLKNLGLTISLEVGYRLSPRGEAYLRGVHAS